MLCGVLARAEVQHSLFTYEKNRNPQNIMNIYTELDADCRITKEPVFEYYWLMNRTRQKPVHSLIRRRIQKEISILASKNPFEFSVLLEKPKELQTDVQQFKLFVTSKKNKDGKCDVENSLALGPSDNNRNIRLKSIYAESKGLIIPDLVSVTLIGEDVKTGEAIRRTYLAN